MIAFVARLNLSQCRRANSRSVPLGRLDLGDRWVTPVFMICAAFSTQCSIVFVQSCKKSGHLSAESVSVWWCGCGYSLLLFQKFAHMIGGAFSFLYPRFFICFSTYAVLRVSPCSLTAVKIASCKFGMILWSTSVGDSFIFSSIQFCLYSANHTSHLNALTL